MLKGLMAGLVTLVLVAFAPSAVAAESARPPKPSFDGAIELRGTHGYKAEGFVFSAGKVGAVTLFVGKGGEVATYTARGEGTENSVDIDLGRLGEINVETRLTGATETLHRGCNGKGKSITIPAYELVGTIDFRGEEGFTEVETTHTPLLVEPLLQIVCGAPSTEGTTGGSGVRGVLVAAKAIGGPSLTVQQNHLGAPVFYRAKMHEKEGPVQVSRTVRGHLGAGALRYDPSLSSASFSAASPFTGSARYVGSPPPPEAGPGRGGWLGSLKVDFPGHANVPVAGPGFKASIVQADRTESNQ